MNVKIYTFLKKKETTMNYHLYNNELLPDALSKEELEALFKKFQSGDKDAYTEIIMHNLRLVIHIINKNFSTINYDFDDLISLGILGLIKAINTFKLNNNTDFSTYASKCISNEILMFLRKLNKQSRFISFDTILFPDKNITLEDTLFDDTDITEDYENQILYQLIRDYVETLPKREGQIIKMYFGFDGIRYSQREIAEHLNKSQAQISRIINKIEGKIAKYLEREWDFNISGDARKRTK